MKRVVIFLSLLFALASCTNRNYVFEQHIDRGWTLASDTLDTLRYFTVPSVAQQTLFDAGLIPHPYLGTVEDELLWISDHPWTYTAHFNANRQMLNVDVVELGDNAFKACKSLSKVVINGKIKEIGSSTFQDCRFLEEITVPESVQKIGSNAFRDCKSLKAISLSDQLEEIGSNAFQDCTSLESIELERIKKIGNGAFQNCLPRSGLS